MATLYILYGSATGNAEGIAKDLAERKRPTNFTSVVCKPLSEFKKFVQEWDTPPSQGRKHGVILISSTTGNGDPPENASRFIRFIKRKETTESMPFKHCAFSVLGLGDTNYDQFCATGLLIDRKLAELGAERAKKMACADEATGLEEVVEPWLDTVFCDVLDACFPSTAIPSFVEQCNEVNASEPSKQLESMHDDCVELVTTPKQSKSALFIMYGSATGNAEQIAKDLAATYNGHLAMLDTPSYFPAVVCCELNQFKKHLTTWEEECDQGTKHGLIIVTSTTGNGDPPENASRFMRYIKKKQPGDLQPFRNVSFAVLGLGDTNYDQFCATGKEIDKRLTFLGGTCAKSLACADEGTGLEDTVEPWKMSVLADIMNACMGTTYNGPIPLVADDTAENKTTFENGDGGEKKSEFPDTDYQTTVRSSCSSGVALVKALLHLKDDCKIPIVPLSLLPSLGASRSSCELFSEDYERTPARTKNSADNATISTSSSEAGNYTQNRPYESKVMAARYLTSTSTSPAAKIFDAVGRNAISTANDFHLARNIFDSAFVLDEESSVTNTMDGKRVIEMLLSLPDDYSLEYQPGDTIGLLVSNHPDDAAFVLSNLQKYHGIMPSQKISIDEGSPITIESAIHENVDLSCALRNKKILNGLSQFAAEEEEANALRLLSSKDSTGLKVFQEYIIEQRRSFTDLLRDFPSCRAITLEGILSLLPAIPPRYYSISSSPLDVNKGGCLAIAYSVVDYLTPSLVTNGREEGRRRIHGVATSYLEAACAPFLAGSLGSFKCAPTLKIFPKPTVDFRLPPSLSTPIVLIGPGTGISPFIGFLSHRRALLSSKDSQEAASTVVQGTWRGGYELENCDLGLDYKDCEGLVPGADYRNHQSVGDVEVYFGCRHRNHDWLFEDEMKQFVSEGVITNLYTAFSRDREKQYVQDLMRNTDASRRLSDLLVSKKGVVYICGDGNSMARDVQSTLAEILSFGADGKYDIALGRSQIERLKREGRLLLDIWS